MTVPLTRLGYLAPLLVKESIYCNAECCSGHYSCGLEFWPAAAARREMIPLYAPPRVTVALSPAVLLKATKLGTTTVSKLFQDV
jgi:hypothetical protein